MQASARWMGTDSWRLPRPLAQAGLLHRACPPPPLTNSCRKQYRGPLLAVPPWPTLGPASFARARRLKPPPFPAAWTPCLASASQTSQERAFFFLPKDLGCEHKASAGWHHGLMHAGLCGSQLRSLPLGREALRVDAPSHAEVALPCGPRLRSGPVPDTRAGGHGFPHNQRSSDTSRTPTQSAADVLLLYPLAPQCSGASASCEAAPCTLAPAPLSVPGCHGLGAVTKTSQMRSIHCYKDTL